MDMYTILAILWVIWVERNQTTRYEFSLESFEVGPL